METETFCEFEDTEGALKYAMCKAIKTVTDLYGLSAEDISIPENIIHKLSQFMCQNYDANKLCKEFILILQQKLDLNLRSVLIELMGIMSKTSKTKINQKISIKVLRENIVNSDSAADVASYIAGRVICSLYYKTRNEFYTSLRLPSNDSKLWILKPEITWIFQKVEEYIKEYLRQVRNDKLLDSIIANKTIEFIGKEEVVRRLNMHALNSDASLNLLIIAIKKYTRTRGHIYAKRFTELYSRLKMEAGKNKTSKSKGKGASIQHTIYKI